MRNKILRMYDAQGRIKVPIQLLDFVGIKPHDEIAICYADHGRVKIKPKDDLEDCEVLAFSKLDEKGRFVYPKALREPDYEEVFDIFVRNGTLFIRDAEI